jgi:large subunit ribosomal protein L19
MDPRIQAIEAAQLKPNRLTFRVGDTVRVHVRIREDEKSRIQPYEGLVIARRSGSSRETFTVRRISYGEGVERTFPIHSPLIEKIQLVKRGSVRRAKLYYLRKKRGKSARIASDVLSGAQDSPAQQSLQQPVDPSQPSPPAPSVRPETPASTKA